MTDPDVRRSYALDATVALAPPPDDFAVVRARDVGDVVAVLEQRRRPAPPSCPRARARRDRAGAVASEGCIVLNVEALDAIHEVNPLEGYAVVGPGVVNAALKRAAAEAGLFYGPDPASWETCTIGGNVATNAGGLCCVKSGVTADWVKALEVVLPGGEVMRTGHRTAKGVAGYDLTGLFVGSEGTLGVVTEAVVRLAPAPDPALTALAVFDSLDAAVAGIVALRLDPHRPCLLEIIDRTSVRAIQAFGDFGFPDDCAAVLLVQSDRPATSPTTSGRYAALLESAGATDVAVADDAQESEACSRVARVMSTAFEAMGARLAEDVCVRSAASPSSCAASRRSASAARCSCRSAACRRRQPAPVDRLRPRRPRQPRAGVAGVRRRHPARGSRSAARSPASTASARSRCRGSGSSWVTPSSRGSSASRRSSTRWAS